MMQEKPQTIRVEEVESGYRVIKEEPDGMEVDQTLMTTVPKEAEDELLKAMLDGKEIAEVKAGVGSEVFAGTIKKSAFFQIGPVSVSIESLLTGDQEP